VFASSGDNGAAQRPATGRASSSLRLPAADPLVTGVGATSLTASQPDGAYQSETSWNDQYGSSGGGYSKLFARRRTRTASCTQAAWRARHLLQRRRQQRPADRWSQGVAANVGNIFLFGGTSAGSPQWAAIIALADQAGHQRLGFINSDLYSLAHDSRYSSVFHDVTSGNNTVSLVDSATTR